MEGGWRADGGRMEGGWRADGGVSCLRQVSTRVVVVFLACPQGFGPATPKVGMRDRCLITRPQLLNGVGGRVIKHRRMVVVGVAGREAVGVVGKKGMEMNAIGMR
jgi:hypothetical protein